MSPVRLLHVLWIVAFAAGCARDASEGRIVVSVQDYTAQQPLLLQSGQGGPALAPLAPDQAEARMVYLADNDTPDDQLGRIDDQWTGIQADSSDIARFERVEGISTGLIDIDGDGFMDTFVRDLEPGDTPTLVVTGRNPRQDGGYLVASNSVVQVRHGEQLRVRIRGWLPTTAPVRVEIWNNWNNGFRYWQSEPRIVSGTVDFTVELVIPAEWPSTNSQTGAAYFSYPIDHEFVYPGDNFVLLGTRGAPGSGDGSDTGPGNPGLILADGAEWVSTATVSAGLSASGAAFYRLANTQADLASMPWTALPEPDGGTVDWTLAAGPDGDRTVWVQYADELGLTSDTASDTVKLDTIPIRLFNLSATPAAVRAGATLSSSFELSEPAFGGLDVTVAGHAMAATCTGTLCSASRVMAGDEPEGPTQIHVVARDAAGWTTRATHPVVIDFTPPNTLIVGAPSGQVNSSSASFGLESNEPGSVFECSLNGAPFTACAATVSLQDLADGPQTFAARAIDPAGNIDPSPAVVNWTVETQPPETVIDSGPAGLVTTSTAIFSFSSPDADLDGFECSLNGAAFATCASPLEITGLADGAHNFRVRAFDLAGNRDPSPAERSWTVDTLAPDTIIIAAPEGIRRQDTAIVSFTSPDGDTVGFECSLNAEPFAACTNPRNLSSLSDGRQDFAVRAVDAAGNRDPSPATTHWWVDTTAPTAILVSAPSNPTRVTLAVFELDADEPVDRFECRLGAGGSFSTCPVTASFAGLSDGSYSFFVRAIDLAGNVQPVPTEHHWTIDTTPPLISGLSVTPPRATTADTVTIQFDLDETPAALTVTVEGVGAVPASIVGSTHTWQYTVVGDEIESWAIVQVVAADAAGNQAQAVGGFEFDFTPPDTITGPTLPPRWSNETMSFIDFSSSEFDSTFECSLNGSAWAACASPEMVGPLLEGPQVFMVRAIDAVGLVDPTPAEVHWDVDLTPPAPPTNLEIGVRPPGTSDQLRGGPGATEPHATIKVYLNAGLTILLAQTAVEPDGSFPFIDIGDDVGDGLEQVYVTATDRAGNESAATAVHNPRTMPRVTRALVTLTLGVDDNNNEIGNPGDTVILRWDNSPDGDANAGITTVTGDVPLLGTGPWAMTNDGSGVYTVEIPLGLAPLDTEIWGTVSVIGTGGLATGPVSSITRVPVDLEPPLPPTPVTGTNAGGSLMVSWGPSPSDDVVFYQVFTRPVGEPWVEGPIVSAGQLSEFADAESCVDTEYAVEAIDDADNRSDRIAWGPINLPMRTPDFETWGDVASLWVFTHLNDPTADHIEVHFTPVTTSTGTPPWVGGAGFGIASPVTRPAGKQRIGLLKMGTEFDVSVRAVKPACNSDFTNVRQARTLGAEGLLGLFLPGSSHSGPGTSETIDGVTFQGGLGFAVANAGDIVDNGGYDDILVGVPGETAVVLVDGKERALAVTQPGYFISADVLGGGPSLAGGVDLDGDGIPDYVIGSPLAATNGAALAGVVRAFSGADDSLLWSWGGAVTGAQMGYAVAVFETATDAYVVVGGVGCVRVDCSGEHATKGTVAVLDGSDGSVVRTHTGSGNESFFGVSVAAGVDLNNDGVADYVVGAPGHFGAGAGPGTVRAFDGATGSEIFSVNGDGRFGAAVAMSPYERATDPGTPRVLVGAPSRSTEGLATVSVLDPDGVVLRTLDGSLPGASNNFGMALAGGGEIDGSGDPMILVGDPNVPLSALYGQGRLLVYRQHDGRLLYEVTGQELDGALGYAMAFIGDLNGDGIGELVVGAPGSQVDDVYSAGRVYILTTRPPD